MVITCLPGTVRAFIIFGSIIIDSLKELVEFKGIYQKKRFDESGKYIEGDDFVAGERGEFPIIVKENGVNYRRLFK